MGDFGQAEFSLNTAAYLELKLLAEQTTTVVGEMRFSQVSPEWKHQLKQRDVYRSIVLNKTFPLSISGQTIADALDILKSGDYVVLEFQDNSSRNADTQLFLNPIQFQEAYKQFLECQKNLLPYTYQDIRNTVLHFATNKAELDQTARSALDKIIDYVKAAEVDYRIAVAAHTDSISSKSFNKKLSLQRANSAVSYLVEHGLSADWITKRAYGERRPKESNKTRAGRAANRRVEVTLTLGRH